MNTTTARIEGQELELNCPDCYGEGGSSVCPVGHPEGVPYCGCIEDWRECEYCDGEGVKSCETCGEPAETIIYGSPSCHPCTFEE